MRWLLGPVMLTLPLTAQAANNEPRYAPPPGWVLPHDAASSPASAKPDGDLAVAYQDVQVRSEKAQDYIYQAYRLKLLGAQALSAGNLQLTWNPASGGITVHLVRIWRNGTPIDVLKSQHFTVLRRENALEQAKLDGLLTATMQVPGLQVGDELEFAATMSTRDPTLDRSFGLVQLPLIGSDGAFRGRVAWTPDRTLTIRTTPDLAASVARTATAAEVTLRQPKAVVFPDRAPPRFLIARQLEFSEFHDWAEMSRTMAPLYATASRLGDKSPLRDEVAAIRKASADPADQATAALRLVQDQVRYVYVGLNGGNLQPAGADTTWTRRFGDCKAKTALLLALLSELGIAARPVLVNSAGGDGIDRYLPSPMVFDHIVVEANVAGRAVWLDGTRTGDSRLLSEPVTPYRWVLPLSAAGEALVERKPVPARLPLVVETFDIDARAGTDTPAKTHFKRILRGDDGLAARAQLALLSAQTATEALKSGLRNEGGWLSVDRAEWNWDEKTAALTLDFTGTTKLDWTKYDDPGAVGWTIFGYGFFPPDRRERPADQDQTLPWAIDFPRFKCIATTLRLPPAPPGLTWDHSGNSMNTRIEGFTYWRMAELKDGIFRMIRSTRSDGPEISATEAARANAAIAGFDNNTASVFMARKAHPAPMRQVPVDLIKEVPVADTVDWTAEDTLCNSRE